MLLDFDLDMQINALEYFERGASPKHRDKIAVIEPAARFTFGQIDAFAKNCAAAILARGVPLNAPIAVLLPKSAATIVADLGAMYCGNPYANLDLKSPPERLKAILGNLGAPLIITAAEHAGVLTRLGVPAERLLIIESAMVERAGGVPRGGLPPGGEPAAGVPAADVEARLLARRERVIDTDPLCIIHTSGSTGAPKGVALNHRSTIDFMDWVLQRFEFDGSEIVGSLSPFYFDIYTLELYLCLAKGATLVIIPEQLAAFPVKLLEFLEAESVSFIFWVPTVMVNIANQQLLPKFSLRALRRVFFAGEVFPTKALNEWRRRLPQAQFVNLYGPIEISVDCTYFILDREMADDEKLPIGFACRNTDILILNDRDQAAEGAEHGELCVRGSSIALGYWNDPQRTARAFVQNPLNPHYPEWIYRTGDIVYRNERGEIMIVGRKDFQIKHMGYRIELGEIEHAALRIPGIENVCAVYQAEKKIITLYFESGRELSDAQLREQLAAFLPKYMLPTRFHRLGQLPRNPNGKIDRNLLATRDA